MGRPAPRSRPTTFQLPLQTPQGPQSPAILDQYWHPQRFGVQLAPAAFRRLIHEHFPTIEVTWQPLTERWLVWERAPRITHPICRGWSLKFVWERPSDHSYKPLDGRLLAALYARSFIRHRTARDPARAYYDRIASEITREREAQRQTTDDETAAIRREYMQYRRIKNIGRGNKFALHHDGSIVPSRGEIDWRLETARST